MGSVFKPLRAVSYAKKGPAGCPRGPPARAATPANASSQIDPRGNFMNIQPEFPPRHHQHPKRQAELVVYQKLEASKRAGRVL